MIKKDKANRENKTIIAFEIVLLVASTFAFSYEIGQAFPSVSAQGQCVQVTKANGEVTVEKAPRGVDISNPAELSRWCDSKGGSSCEATDCASSLPSTSLVPSLPLPQNPSRSAEANAELSRQIATAGGDITADSVFKIGNKEMSARDIANANLVGKTLWGDKLTVKGLLRTATYITLIQIGTKYAKKIGIVSPELAQAIGNSLSVGVFVHETAIPLLQKIGLLNAVSGPAGWIASAIIAAIVFGITYKATKYEMVTFTCTPWLAPFGGSDCTKCGNDGFPCTEYRCKSLGQGCELLYPGTADAACVWNNSRDVTPPVINAWPDILTDGYKYIPANVSSPPDRGVRIVNEKSDDGCITPWERLTIGITVNKSSICKYSDQNSDSYDNMENRYWSGGISKYNHSMSFSLPSQDYAGEQNATLGNNGEFTLYTRCKSINGVSSPGNFVFRYCVGKSDFTDPKIISTSINNNSYVGFGQASTNLDIYINKESECKWSRIDQDYENMENKMDCSAQSSQVNGQIVFPCSTTLTGLNDYPAQNDYYFRCKDPLQNGSVGVNKASYLFRLLGSRTLSITSFGPNGTISDSTTPIAVTLDAKTFAGAEEGAATCKFSQSENSGFTVFKTTGSNEHTQRLDLAPGDYTFYARCIDLGGNIAENSTSFTVIADTQAPIIVRAFHEGSSLNIITNEKANCVYNDKPSLGCTYLFETGKTMTSTDNIKHQTDWNPDKTFYIKCADEFGNKPSPENTCSMIVSPFSIR